MNSISHSVVDYYRYDGDKEDRDKDERDVN